MLKKSCALRPDFKAWVSDFSRTVNYGLCIHIPARDSSLIVILGSVVSALPRGTTPAVGTASTSSLQFDNDHISFGYCLNAKTLPSP